MNIMQEKMSANFQARGVRHICTWKGSSTSQQSCWDEISFGSAQLLLFVLLCVACCFEKSNIYIKNMIISLTNKSANFILQGETSETSICSVTLGISIQLQAPWKFSLSQNLAFRGFCFCTPQQFLSCLREEGIYIRRVFFSVSRSWAQEKAGIQGFTDHQGFVLSLSCSWFYGSYFLYGNLIKKVIPSEHKAVIEQ